MRFHTFVAVEALLVQQQWKALQPKKCSLNYVSVAVGCVNCTSLAVLGMQPAKGANGTHAAEVLPRTTAAPTHCFHSLNTSDTHLHSWLLWLEWCLLDRLQLRSLGLQLNRLALCNLLLGLSFGALDLKVGLP